MKIEIRNPLPGETAEDYQKYLDEQLKPISDLIANVRALVRANNYAAGPAS
jgi:hypothetical protein